MAGRNSSPESVVPAAWHPDPAGRHEMRYWDGRSWTSHICDNGAVGIDQL
ncbi:MAG: hypothetical protein CVT59_05615 [Actinobacteria bacterium HGW-Actinobacteria-1]|nr:MAG: hypothetical protein CVT59_05615 [Actinobacteria bacterium HGW-Actinobacteria-1]